MINDYFVVCLHCHDYFHLRSLLLGLLFLGGMCDDVDCGRGLCQTSANSTFGFECKCDHGWTQLQFLDHVPFLPCVIPKCKSRLCSCYGLSIRSRQVVETWHSFLNRLTAWSVTAINVEDNTTFLTYLMSSLCDLNLALFFPQKNSALMEPKKMVVVLMMHKVDILVLVLRSKTITSL